MLTIKTLGVRSLVAFALSLTVFGADAPQPQVTSAKPVACSTTVKSESGTQVADIDAYGKCVYKCLQRKGTNPDYCAQSCAGLLQSLQEEKRKSDILAEPSISE